MRIAEAAFITSLASAFSVGAPAQGLHALRPVAGWKCMKLNLSEQQSMAPTVHVLERTGPSAQSAVGGWAPITVAVPSPPVSTNGFLQVLRPNGKRLWISDRDVVVWKSLADPSARCVPAYMSNGTIGFDYSK